MVACIGLIFLFGKLYAMVRFVVQVPNFLPGRDVVAYHLKCLKCGWEETEHGDVIPMGQPESIQDAFFSKKPGFIASRFECTEYEPPAIEFSSELNRQSQYGVSG